MKEIFCPCCDKFDNNFLYNFDAPVTVAYFTCYNESVIYPFNPSTSENIMNTRESTTILVITNGLTDTHSLRLRLRYI